MSEQKQETSGEIVSQLGDDFWETWESLLFETAGGFPLDAVSDVDKGPDSSSDSSLCPNGRSSRFDARFVTGIKQAELRRVITRSLIVTHSDEESFDVASRIGAAVTSNRNSAKSGRIGAFGPRPAPKKFREGCGGGGGVYFK